AVEFYVDGDDMPSATYQADDHQWLVDHHNRFDELKSGTPGAVGASFLSAVKTTATGYTVEMRVGHADVGRPAAFASGAFLGFDFGGDDGDGMTQTGAVLWWNPLMTCTNCGCYPYCNPLKFGTLVLQP